VVSKDRLNFSMFGESLLVAPVFHASIASYYLPAGRWTCLWTDEVVEGPRWVKKTDYPLTCIPVFVKENSVILLGPADVKIPDYEYSKVELEVRAYEITKDVEVAVPTGSGKSIAGTIKVSTSGVDSGAFKVTEQRTSL